MLRTDANSVISEMNYSTTCYQGNYSPDIYWINDDKLYNVSLHLWTFCQFFWFVCFMLPWNYSKTQITDKQWKTMFLISISFLFTSIIYSPLDWVVVDVPWTLILPPGTAYIDSCKVNNTHPISSHFWLLFVLLSPPLSVSHIRELVEPPSDRGSWEHEPLDGARTSRKREQLITSQHSQGKWLLIFQ